MARRLRIERGSIGAERRFARPSRETEFARSAALPKRHFGKEEQIWRWSRNDDNGLHFPDVLSL